MYLIRLNNFTKILVKYIIYDAVICLIKRWAVAETTPPANGVIVIFVKSPEDLQ